MLSYIVCLIAETSASKKLSVTRNQRRTDEKTLSYVQWKKSSIGRGKVFSRSYKDSYLTINTYLYKTHIG